AGTDAVLFCGEIGGDKEYALAEAMRGYPKPVVAMVVGRHAPAEKRMGHAGALVGSAREGADARLSALAGARRRVGRGPQQAGGGGGGGVGGGGRGGGLGGRGAGWADEVSVKIRCISEPASVRSRPLRRQPQTGRSPFLPAANPPNPGAKESHQA